MRDNKVNTAFRIKISPKITAMTGLTVVKRFATESASPMPKTSDDAPVGSSNDTHANGTILMNVYFVFIVLLAVFALGVVFLVYRRRHVLRARRRARQQQRLQQDLAEGSGGGVGGERGGWEPPSAGQRYWQGRWASVELDPVEGLDERGEAPPPYLKRPSQEALRSGDRGERSPTAPPQVLLREGAGLKPPDYSETQAREVGRRSSTSTAASSSRPAREGGIDTAV